MEKHGDGLLFFFMHAFIHAHTYMYLVGFHPLTDFGQDYFLDLFGTILSWSYSTAKLFLQILWELLDF